jgi:RHS repeat-associated protein
MKRINRVLSWILIIVLVSGANVPLIATAYGKSTEPSSRKVVPNRTARRSTNKSTQAPTQLDGQTSTPLAEGGLLIAGGQRSSGPTKAAWIRDGVTGEFAPHASGMNYARAFHSATMLPDGNVLIVGGIGPSGQLESRAEIFDFASQRFRSLKQPFSPRAYHTATLLTDGRVLITGGITEKRNASFRSELWDYKTETTSTAKLSLQRKKHKATLLADGSVALEGGEDAVGNALDIVEIFDPLTNTFNVVGSSPESAETGAPYAIASDPVNGAVGVSVDTKLSLRFSRRLRVDSINSESMALLGPNGNVETTVVPAENGRLIFINPGSPLLPGVSYVVSLSKAVDETDQPLQTAALTFTTKSLDIPRGTIDDADWIPDERNFHGEWKIKHEDSPWRSLMPLQAEPGVTAIAGQVLTLDGKPLRNVTLTNGSKSTLTDETGRFLLSSINSGHNVLTIDGRSAGHNKKQYGIFRVGVDVAEGKTHSLGYSIWMPKLDTANTVTISSPTNKDSSITNPRIPGLELKLPAGTVIRDLEGQTVSQLTITPIPTNRPPFPLPAGVDVPVYFTIQPGGSQIIPPRAQLIYPNFIGSKPGQRIDFWNYDPTGKGWYVYGQGTVTPNGQQIIPDPGVVLYEFSGAMVGRESLAPLFNPFDDSDDGDPVNLGTGLLIVEKTDLALPGTIPINFTRTYRQNDSGSRPFGIGATHQYEMFLVGNTNPWTYIDLILPDGGRVHYDRISPGTIWLDAVYEAIETPTAFHKSRISFNGNGWDLKLKDGTLLVFPESFAAARSNQCALLRIQDRFGNVLNMTRDASSNLTKITTPNGRWIQFSYDSNYRITQATDNIGRTVVYTYDPSGRLWKVTDPKNGVTEYTYDSSHRMLTITDARGILYLTNEYDTNGRVIKQTLADDTPGNPNDNPTYRFAYATDSGGRIVQTDVTDPRGHIRRVTFNTDGYTLTDTSGLGTSVEQGISVERQSGTNFITAFIDALGRRSEYTYDSMGNILTASELVGTTAAATTTFTYDPSFNLVTSVTDALDHTTSYSYDSKGSMLSVTDPLNHTTSFQYNSAGQVISITDPLQNTSQFIYDSGDLVQMKDPLNRTASIFLDGAGRILRVNDALGRGSRYEYDPLNQLSKFTDPLGSVSECTYDPNGNLLTVKDARNQTTTFTYDNMDRVLTRVDSLQGGSSAESFEYDVEGNPTKWTDRRGKVTTTAYDALDRPIFVGFGTSAGPTYESTTDYTYDLYDRITQVADSVSGTITISFDDIARTASEASSLGTVGFTYDKLRRLIGKTVTGQSSISYTYDNASRLLSITQGLASTGFTYDDANRRSTLTLPNGIVAEYGFDAASQLTALTYKNGSTVIGDLTYTYDQTGQRTKVGGSLARTGLPQPLASATYNGANRLTQRDSMTLTYDANGNLTNDGTSTYTWDARNQLISISGAVNAAFQYDSFGRRTGKTINGSTTAYLYDGENVVQESVGGNVSANLLTGDLDEIFSRTEGSSTQSVLVDGLGSSLALLSASGATQTEYTYEPFGNASVSGSASDNPSQYTGRDNDGSGLYYYRARYYSPVQQRFISEDPIDFEGGDTNLYSYVGNNPCNVTDPTGNSPLMACGMGALYVFYFDSLVGRKTTVRRLIKGCMWGAIFGLMGRLLGALRGRPWLPRVRPGSRGPSTGGPKCFVAGTLIQTAEGEKRIENVREGDLVLSSDPARSDTDSRPESKLVTQTFERTADEVFDIRVGNTMITATAEHPFWVVGSGWTAAGELRRGSALLTKEGVVVHVDTIERREGKFKVYNFEVSGTHTYYVSSLGLLVHNQCTPGGGATKPGPTFLGQENGPAIPVPKGAQGPSPAWNGKGVKYEGGAGGNGLSPNVNGVRVMDPKPGFPDGYVNYGKTLPNGSWQTVNPYNGTSVGKGSPWWHIPR